ncbi:LysE family translocator [Pelagibacterium sp. 26DY04]|uniref:LysE family translocator n=1 Tax=Pelagibacterium sp. 26DY04 TaxID=2967130 RepID=UPI00281594BA|nr:LysE family translocator [Pelagibacterium sp. 26DY04]WMT85757.1 LysE family translocator [Pelagibacterium sp. 26DY04]
MLDGSLVAAFVLAAASSYFSPGPNNLMLMTSSAKFGIGATVPHAAGIVFGFPLMVFVVGLGLGEIFTAYPWVNTIMRYGAAIYFLWMAWTMLGIKIGSASGGERPMRLYEAAAFQWINPKAWVMAIGFVALFVPPGEGRLTSLVLVTIGCIALSPVSCGTWMVFGRGLIAFLRRTGGERYLGWILAALMLASVVLFLI